MNRQTQAIVTFRIFIICRTWWRFISSYKHLHEETWSITITLERNSLASYWKNKFSHVKGSLDLLWSNFTFHNRTTTSAWVSSSRIRPKESVIAANVPLGDKVSLSPFLGWSFKHVKGDAATICTETKSIYTIVVAKTNNVAKVSQSHYMQFSFGICSLHVMLFQWY